MLKSNSSEKPIQMSHEDLRHMCQMCHLTLQEVLETLNEVAIVEVVDTPGIVSAIKRKKDEGSTNNTTEVTS